MSNSAMNHKEEMKERVMDAMHFRHATKVYDSNRKISDADFEYILEVGRLSPSSLGAEPWKFLVVQDTTLREKLLEVAPGAIEKLKTASHFVIMLSRVGMRYDSEYLTNHMKNVQHYPEEMIDDIRTQYKYFQENKNINDNSRTLADWTSKQTYIAMGNMLTAAALIGIDSSPMEGFHQANLTALLEAEGLLEDGAFEPSVLMAFGYRKENPKRPKTRRKLEDVVQWV